MDRSVLEKLVSLTLEPASVVQTKAYLEGFVRTFLRRNERVLICLPNRGEGSLASLLSEVVTNAGGIPTMWGPDYRWKGLLRQAFESRVTVIVGPPLLVLGLTKLAKATGTPLFIRNVLTAGYPCMDWMIDGIRRGLDCHTWGCFDPGAESVIAGFSCGVSRGVHLRDDLYDVEIVDKDGTALPDGAVGELYLIHKSDRSLRYRTGQQAKLVRSACACGRPSPRLMEISRRVDIDSDLAELAAQILDMTSVLDCKLHKGLRGLEMELVVFRGETLPPLPSCAKRVVRYWDPNMDSPFSLTPDWKSAAFYGENH